FPCAVSRPRQGTAHSVRCEPSRWERHHGQLLHVFRGRLQPPPSSARHSGRAVQNAGCCDPGESRSGEHGAHIFGSGILSFLISSNRESSESRSPRRGATLSFQCKRIPFKGYSLSPSENSIFCCFSRVFRATTP